MSLTQDPVIVHCGTTHYVFVEKVGPFNETAPQSWQELHALVPEIAVKNKIGKYFAEYKVDSKAVYRAGVSVAAAPTDLPAGARMHGNQTKFTGVLRPRGWEMNATAAIVSSRILSALFRWG